MSYEGFSPYAQFHQALRFVDVFRRSTDQRVHKFELWEAYGGDEHAVMELTNRIHPDFKFIPNPLRKKEADDFIFTIRGLLPPKPKTTCQE